MADTKTAEILKERYERLQAQAHAAAATMETATGEAYQMACVSALASQAAANRTLKLYEETLARF